MSFSFNWAGISVPHVQRTDKSDRAVQAAGLYGQAVRGYQKMKADDEYKNLIDEYGKSRKDAGALKQELADLKKRNQEIAAQLGL